MAVETKFQILKSGQRLGSIVQTKHEVDLFSAKITLLFTGERKKVSQVGITIPELKVIVETVSNVTKVQLDKKIYDFVGGYFEGFEISQKD